MPGLAFGRSAQRQYPEERDFSAVHLVEQNAAHLIPRDIK
jgi:hypothetical protein